MRLIHVRHVHTLASPCARAQPCSACACRHSTSTPRLCRHHGPPTHQAAPPPTCTCVLSTLARISFSSEKSVTCARGGGSGSSSVSDSGSGGGRGSGRPFVRTRLRGRSPSNKVDRAIQKEPAEGRCWWRCRCATPLPPAAATTTANLVHRRRSLSRLAGLRLLVLIALLAHDDAAGDCSLGCRQGCGA